ncbi:MAG: hypothetical protein DWQ04_01520 [Chloroflexi bacterium]|nr:MAG: hypothetical protein DWQ04_01520 [Chloroflexota bacterium]
MVEMQPSSENSISDDEPLQQFIEQWLVEASPDLADAARYAAIPHHFDVTLLSLLRGTAEHTQSLVDKLQKAGFVFPVESEKFGLLPTIRDFLLRDWHRNNQQTYRRLSSQAATYYQNRDPFNEADQMEVLYHQLGADDKQGIAYLSPLFEWAWNGRLLGRAEQLLRIANEQKPVLDPAAQAWLLYFQARLDAAYHRSAQSAKTLNALLDQPLSPTLKAQVLVNLGNVQIQRQRWTVALAKYEEALDLFLEMNDSLGARLVCEARGNAYIHLASKLGGLPETPTIPLSRFQKWLHYFLHLPFLLYRWFSRRITFLPNLYFGTDYQDWVIIRLLYEAIRQFEQASTHLEKLPTAHHSAAAELSADIQIRLADLYHRVGDWARADRLFHRISNAPAVKTNEYRRAVLQLGEGRAALGRSQSTLAREKLQAAHEVFLRYGDQSAVVVTTRLLGDRQMADGDPDAAVSFYLESIEAALTANDLLALTRVWSMLTALQTEGMLSKSTKDRVNALAKKIDRRVYIARFPGLLLQRFRKLAAYVVLPLTYLLGPILIVQFAFLFNILESIYQTMRVSSLTGVIELITGLIFILILVSFTLWLYEFCYVIAGWFFVRRLPFKYVAKHQPKYVVVTSEGIAVRDEQDSLQELGWNHVKGFTSLNRALWNKSLPLFSRLLLYSDKHVFLLDGIIHSYDFMHRDIKQRLKEANSSLKMLCLDYSLFASRWTLPVLGLTFLVMIVDLTGLFDPQMEPNLMGIKLRDGNTHDLLFSSILYLFTLWAFNFFPLTGLGRLLINRLVAQRSSGKQFALGFNWPLWLAFIFLLLWTLNWILGMAA